MSTLNPEPTNAAVPASIVSKLQDSMSMGRVPIIVMGSGMSAGVGAPTMSAIHNYLSKELGKQQPDDGIAVLQELLEILNRAEVESPRSVQVRLYHLLQRSSSKPIRAVWTKFGADLMAGAVAAEGAKPPKKEPAPLWNLSPSSAHLWAARLALQNRAAVVSLNYDGLTRKAIDMVAASEMQPPPDGCQTARILSSAEEIRSFFTGIEIEAGLTADPSTEPATKRLWRPVPIIKFRGDVFHAVCENGRCPTRSKPAPLYDLLNLPRRGDVPLQIAINQLRCPNCGKQRELQISFPGVYGKEKEIDEALAAFHEIFGRSIAGVIFLGFSGKWDEGLVEYFSETAEALKAPVISFSKDHTPVLKDASNRRAVEYAHCPFESQNPGPGADASHPLLEGLLGSSVESVPSGKPATTVAQEVEFPNEAFHIFGQTPPRDFDIELPTGTPAAPQHIKVVAASNHDSFTELAGAALRTRALDRLQRCSQLGLKADFVYGADARHHSRFYHSAAAAMVAMLWYEALSRKHAKPREWAWTEEARIALELAVLFHDARHLPFSHMMEEVLFELNWGHVPDLAWPEIHRYVEEVRPELHGTDFGQRLKAQLHASGVEVSDLQAWWSKIAALQNSCSGVPWLEAIADSALDADKIEYLFHDTQVTGQNVRLTRWDNWFQTFLSDQSLTPEGLIRLEGESCIAALELLQERMHLYRRLYLAPELRALETLARYIVLTWLKWKVPDEVDESDLTRLTGYDLEHSLRGIKSGIAGKLLWDLYDPGKAPRELAGLSVMVAELKGMNALDEAALVWLDGLWRHLEQFTQPGKAPSMQHARRVYSQMNPIGPFYVHERYEKDVRRIIRLWRVHYPLVALVDVVHFPRFLSTPRNRRKRVGSENPTAEHFLVPSMHPSEWHRKLRATTPLHKCDFRAYEYPVLQLVIFDPWGEPSGGSAFLHQMLRVEFERLDIQIKESPEQVT